MLSRCDLNAFLSFCYLPSSSTRFLQPITDDKAYCTALRQSLSQKGEEAWITEGAKVLMRAFEREVYSARGLQVVPLSGGLDSRLILAHLIEAGLRNQIIAVTFGTPGALDFEIPKEVARLAQVRHELIDLNAVPVSVDDLKYAYRCGSSWSHLFIAYYNHLIKKLFPEDATYWSGFLGDPLAGSHYKPGYEQMSWDEAKQVFLKANRWRGTGNPEMHEPGFSTDSVLPEEPFMADRGLVSYPEQLDFCIRQSAHVHKDVVGAFGNVRTPYANPEWVRFMFAAPPHWREGCKLYHQIMLHRFPSLFRVRTKSVPTRYLDNSLLARYSRRVKSFCPQTVASWIGNPMHSSRYNAGLNYIDFAQAYRTREDFRVLAETSLGRLERRDIITWIEPRSLLRRHLQHRGDLYREINMLISLEVNLEMQEDCETEFLNQIPG